MMQRRSRVRRQLQLARWLIRTPWPVFALDMLRANLVGGFCTFAFVRFGLPSPQAAKFDDISTGLQILFISYLVLAMIIGIVISAQLAFPVLMWHRGHSRLSNESARRRALRLPAQVTYVYIASWIVGAIVFFLINLTQSLQSAVLVLAATVAGGSIACMLAWTQAEKVLRPVTAAALANNPEGSTYSPSTRFRIIGFWVVGTFSPVLWILLLITAQYFDFLDCEVKDLIQPIVIILSCTLAFSAVTLLRIVGSITDPIKQLRRAQQRVSSGDLDVSLDIYDTSDLGSLQAGFNDMVAELRERANLRNLFGRYVGEDVARRAIETGADLGGEERYVGVLFVDIVGSTRLAVTRPPREVVTLLNEFFRIIVDVVSRHGGFVNKFQGDAALAIFGAPLDQPEFASSALAAARELRLELLAELPDADIGIGVSAGKAIAGHIGSEQRLEYTVIGDPVNEAARLTEMAKFEPDRVLGSARAVYLADEDEAERWSIGEGIELRGRGIETRLARPDLSLRTHVGAESGAIPDAPAATTAAATSSLTSGAGPTALEPASDDAVDSPATGSLPDTRS